MTNKQRLPIMALIAGAVTVTTLIIGSNPAETYTVALNRNAEHVLQQQQFQYITAAGKRSTEQKTTSVRGKLVEKKATTYTIQTENGPRDVLITRITKFEASPKIGDLIEVDVGREMKALTIREGRSDESREQNGLRPKLGFY